jgi:hypothetical protein
MFRSEYFIHGLRIAAVAAFCCFLLPACNRAGMRIPGASLDFPETPTRYTAQKSYPYSIVVLPPVDLRPDHYGERVAGTRWTGCTTDASLGRDVVPVVRERLVKELAASKLFATVSQDEAVKGDLILRSEIHAFCSQVVGFIYSRVAGIVALNIVVERDGQPVFKEKLERVVTDADPQYTGSQVTFIEQAMRVTMMDSLRELLRDFLQHFDRAAAGWSAATGS